MVASYTPRMSGAPDPIVEPASDVSHFVEQSFDTCATSAAPAGAPSGTGAAPQRVLATAAPAFRFVDLFAGIGGVRIGLESAGGECVASVEIDRFARETYEANFGTCEGRDIHDVRGGDLPPYDVLAAGFPCQPFSIAGVSKKLSLGRLHGFDDVKSGNLFFEITRLIEEAGAPPPVLFLENVKNLLSHDRGNTFRVISEALEDLGYNLNHRVIDGQAWVPQHRERTYIIGLHRDAFGEERFEFPDPPDLARRTIGEILEPHPDPRYVLSQHLWDYLQAYARKHKAAGNGFGFGLVGPDSVSRTLSARYHKDGSEILVATDGPRPRRLTPRECARLMGFPETFVIPVSDTQAYRQFGNSVVMPVVAHLAGHLTARYISRIAAKAA
jgi:DNA (cytosine-5)-methyltransferase 1